MTSRSRPTKRILSLIISLSLILTASLLFGQVLGNLYLGNITATGNIKTNNELGGGAQGNTKVLRLKAITYYTIEVASYTERAVAVQLGNSLATKGLPVVITGTAPHQVKLGFLNNEEKLALLAQTITVDGKKAEVIKGEINSISFKFAEENTYAVEVVAPFLGDLSICLEKAVLLNSDLDSTATNVSRVKSRFIELAADLEALASRGTEIANQGSNTQYATYLTDLVIALHAWAQNLKYLETEWSNKQLLNSQQQALAVLEEYQKLIISTN